MRSHAPFSLIVPLMMGLILFHAASALAENEGLDDLDKATDAKLTAKSFQDLGNVVNLAQSAIDKGLDKDNLPFAEKLLVSTLVQRASLITKVLFSQPAADARWQQLRRAALTDLERAVKLQDDLPDAHLSIGRLQAMPGGDREKAIAALTKVIDSKQAAKVTQASAYIVRGGLQTDPDQRLADFTKAAELEPKDAQALRGRGLALLQQEKVDEAIADFDKAIKLEPDHAGTHEARGLAMFAKQDYDEALASFGKAIELAPKLPGPLLQRARVYIVKDDLPAAIKDLDQAVALNPRDAATLVLRSQVHGQAGNMDKAFEDIDQVIKMRPGWLPALQMRINLLAAGGKLGEAITEMEQLKDEYPTNAELWLRLGQLYVSDSRPREAIEVFSKVLAADANNWLALRSRGDTFLSVAKQAAAIKDYRAALKIQPESSGLLNNLAWVLATSPDDKLRSGKEAVDLAKKACEVTEYTQGHILSTLAAAYAETGDYESAKRWSAKAVEIGREEDKEQLKKELESYQAKKPWRELQDVEEKKSDAPAAGSKTPAQTAEF